MLAIFGLDIKSAIAVNFLFYSAFAGANVAKLLPVEGGSQYIGSSSIKSVNQEVGVYFEKYDESFDSAKVYFGKLVDAKFELNELTSVGDYKLIALPSFVFNKYLYVVASQKYWGTNGKVFRINLETNLVESVSMPRGLSVGSLLRVKVMVSGRMLATYRAGKSNIFIAESTDGLFFKNERSLATGTMPDISQFSNGALISTYQAGPDLYNMQVYFSILDKDSSTNLTKRLVEEKNVHDAFVLQRRDGNVDAYFVKQAIDEERLILSRRCIGHDGDLGVEEILLDDKQYNIAKPNAQQLSMNEVIVSFINQTSPTSSSLYYMTLNDNAPSCQ